MLTLMLFAHKEKHIFAGKKGKEEENPENHADIIFEQPRRFLAHVEVQVILNRSHSIF